MPAASISARPQTSTWSPGSARARSASALGVISLAGRVLEVAARVGGLGRGRGPLDLGARVVVRGDDQLLEPRVVVGVGLVTRGTRRRRARCPRRSRARRRGAGSPSTAARCPAPRAAGHRGGGHAGALGVELVALAEPDEHVAVAAGVGDRELAQAGAGLAGVDQRPAGPRRRHGRSALLRRRRRRSCRLPCPAAPEWSNSRAWDGHLNRLAPMPRTVILGAARTPVGKLGGGLSSLHPTELGGIAIKAALERAEVAARAGPARDHGPGAPGGHGADPLAAGADQGRDPEGGLLGDDQQGLRVGHPRRRPDRPGGARRRPRRGGRRRHGVDVAGAVPAAEGALRRPHGRHEGARRDGPGRPAQPVHRQADVRGGDRGRRAARDDPRGPRQVGAALARAHDRGHRRRPAAGGDRRR